MASPDRVSLIALGQRPVVLRRHVGEAEEFGLQIVIREQFIDTPQPQRAECRRKEMGVHVDELGSSQYFFDSGVNLIHRKRLWGIELSGGVRSFGGRKFHGCRAI